MLTQVSFFLWKVVVQTISNFFRIFCECIPQYIVLTSFQFQEMRNWIRKKLFGYSIKRKNFSLKRRRSTKMNYEVFVNKTLNLYHLKLYYTREYLKMIFLQNFWSVKPKGKLLKKPKLNIIQRHTVWIGLRNKWCKLTQLNDIQIDQGTIIILFFTIEIFIANNSI